MTSQPSNPDDDRMLAALALALVDNSRATLQDLARAVGVSKATLYRFCRTREELVERLIRHGSDMLDGALSDADLDTGAPIEALRRLITLQLNHRELTVFLVYYWRPDAELGTEDTVGWTEYLEKVDAFFLRGQREGVFRIDITAAAMSEVFTSVFCGLVDAERRGRVARAGMPQVIETLFMRGAQT